MIRLMKHRADNVFAESVGRAGPLTRCKLCGGNTTWKFSLPLTDNLKGEYFECQKCHMLQSAHLDTMTPAQMQAFYDAKRGSIDSDGAWRQLCIFERVETLVRFGIIRPFDGYKVLDYGGGSGFVASCLASRHGWSTMSYDAFEAPLFTGTKPLRDMKAVVQNSPYDLIIVTQVLEHFTNPKEDISRISTILSGDGAVYVTTGLYRPGKHDSTWPYLVPQSGEHVSFYSAQTMREVARLLQASAYQIGTDDEWLFVRRPPSNLARVRIAAGSALLRQSTLLRQAAGSILATLFRQD